MRRAKLLAAGALACYGTALDAADLITRLL
jgi:hypothetical protein